MKDWLKVRERELKTWLPVAILAFAGVLLTTSCTTASYGNKFAPDSSVADQYRFKIYVGGVQFAPPNAQAEERIKEFMSGKDYSAYEILNRRYNFIPSFYEFTVQFRK